jgi:hypothetical protein
MLQVEPAPRLGDVQLWWMAATLARRHPELTVVEAIKPAGAGEALTLVREDDWIASFDLDGHLWVGDLAGVPLVPAFESEDPLRTVTLVEQIAGLKPSAKTPAATPRTLMYRVAAALVAMTANDRERLRVRSEWTGMEDGAASVRGGVAKFPLAMNRVVPDLAAGNFRWVTRFWLVERGDEVVAAMDTDGMAYLPDREFSMPEIYAQQDRKVLGVLHSCFASLLS